jgi:hypothetical protein
VGDDESAQDEEEVDPEVPEEEGGEGCFVAEIRDEELEVEGDDEERGDAAKGRQ